MSETTENLRCLIIGSGPAGYTAAIYAARADLKPVIYQGLEPGGQLTITTDVDNFPGYPEGVKGPEMMEDLKKQAERFGTEVRFGIVTKVDFSSRPFKVEADDGKTVMAETVIIATGATAKWLGLESEITFRGMGVSACATCDGFFYRGKTVGVIGNADFALKELHDLMPFAASIVWLTNGRPLDLSTPLSEMPEKTTLDERLLAAVDGDGEVLRAVVFADGSRTSLDGLFIAEGTASATDFAIKLGIPTAGNAIVTDRDCKTALPGFFAAGDCTGGILQIAVAVGEGASAGLSAAKFVREKKSEEKATASK